jgi:hypothetical protein
VTCNPVVNIAHMIRTSDICDYDRIPALLSPPPVDLADDLAALRVADSAGSDQPAHAGVKRDFANAEFCRLDWPNMTDAARTAMFAHWRTMPVQRATAMAGCCKQYCTLHPLWHSKKPQCHWITQPGTVPKVYLDSLTQGALELRTSHTLRGFSEVLGDHRCAHFFANKMQRDLTSICAELGCKELVKETAFRHFKLIHRHQAAPSMG